MVLFSMTRLIMKPRDFKVLLFYFLCVFLWKSSSFYVLLTNQRPWLACQKMPKHTQQYGSHSCANEAGEEALQPALTQSLEGARLQLQSTPADDTRGGGRFPGALRSKRRESSAEQVSSSYMAHTVTHKKIISGPVSIERPRVITNTHCLPRTHSLCMWMGSDPYVHMHLQTA